MNLVGSGLSRSCWSYNEHGRELRSRGQFADFEPSSKGIICLPAAKGEIGKVQSGTAGDGVR